MRDYSQASINLRDGYRKLQRSKYANDNERVSEKGRYLMKLTQVVPNWETYLTEIQLNSTRHYLESMSIVETARKMKVVESTCYVNLFGENNNHNKSLGALGRLLKAYTTLKETGYYERLEKKKNLKGD